MMRVLVCGSRGWSDREVIYRELAKLPSDTTVIHGAARGADTIAGEVAEELGFAVVSCPAQWSQFGRAAGIVRNQQMLSEESPDLVLAFPRDLANSPGTKHMISIARKAGVEVRVFEGQDKSTNREIAVDQAPTTAGGDVVSFTKVSLPNGWLSNMSAHAITYQGYEYATAEALFQCLRFDDPKIQTTIWEQSSPMAAKMVSKKHRDKMIIPRMGQQDVENMGMVLMLKIEQHRAIRRLLLQTGDATLIEDCTQRKTQDSALFWGAAWTGTEWRGENRLGRLWMELRGEIRNGEW